MMSLFSLRTMLGRERICTINQKMCCWTHCGFEFHAVCRWTCLLHCLSTGEMWTVFEKKCECLRGGDAAKTGRKSHSAWPAISRFNFLTFEERRYLTVKVGIPERGKMYEFLLFLYTRECKKLTCRVEIQPSNNLLAKRNQLMARELCMLDLVKFRIYRKGLLKII